MACSWFASDDDMVQSMINASSAIAPVKLKKVHVERQPSEAKGRQAAPNVEPPQIVSLVMKKAGLQGPLLSNRSLPSCLRVLDLESNRIDGEVDLACMPRTLQVINLSYNQLSGPLLLDRLPPDLRSLKLHANRFSGHVVLSKLPSELTEAFFHENQISSFSLSRQQQLLSAAGAEESASLMMDQHSPVAKEVVYLDCSVLPASLRLLNLSSNPTDRKYALENKRQTLTVWT